jgi:lysophospholipid acyltransferase (LPLAT)-like uncharacterized protein
MEVESGFRKVPWYKRLGGLACAVGLRRAIDFLDVEIAYYDRSIDPRQPEYFEPCIYLFWHEYLALLVGQWAHCPITMLVSQHRDAEWLNQIADRLGFTIVRGSTRRGGSQAIRELRRVCKTQSLGITPDGPRGPRRQMAMGPVFLASMFQMPIVPVGIGYCRPWRFNTWDQFALGRPGSRARIVTGPKMYLPAKMERDEMESTRVRIESMINQLTRFAEQWATQGFHVPAGERPPRARRRSAGSDSNPRPHHVAQERRAA